MTTTTDERGNWRDRLAVRPTRLDLLLVFVGVTVVYCGITLAIDATNLFSVLVIGPASGLAATSGCFERAKRNRQQFAARAIDEQLSIHRAVRTGTAPSDPTLDVDVRLLAGERRLRRRRAGGRLDELERQLDARAAYAPGSSST
jgi:hypothetical protein